MKMLDIESQNSRNEVDANEVEKQTPKTHSNGGQAIQLEYIVLLHIDFS